MIRKNIIVLLEMVQELVLDFNYIFILLILFYIKFNNIYYYLYYIIVYKVF